MPKFLIEVPHEEETVSCTRAVKIFLESGSHFLTHADRGCKDGEHKAWLFADVDSKDKARAILPPGKKGTDLFTENKSVPFCQAGLWT